MSYLLETTQTKTILYLTLAEKKREDLSIIINDYLDMFPASKVVKIIVDRLKLPIRINNYALLIINSYCKNDKEAKILLIDCLGKYENQGVGTNMICNLYPNGFYRKKEVDSRCKQISENPLGKWNHIFHQGV